MKPLLVGESNPYHGDPGFALYPEPLHATGDRLCRLIMKVPPDQYLRDFDRVNLCAGKWSMHAARAHAAEIRAGAYTKIVLLGKKVCDAFGITGEPFASVDVSLDGGPMKRFVLLPHPSGLNRTWSVPGAFGRARAVLVEAGVLQQENHNG